MIIQKYTLIVEAPDAWEQSFKAEAKRQLGYLGDFMLQAVQEVLNTPLPKDLCAKTDLTKTLTVKVSQEE